MKSPCLSRPLRFLAALSFSLLIGAKPGIAQDVSVNGLAEFTTSQTMTSLTIGANGVARLAPGPGLSIDTQSLNISPSGVLDLAFGNVLVVRAPDAAANAANLATITAWIKSGLNNGASGLWQGRGIVSSDAANDPNHLKAVGVLDNSQFGYSDFGGVTGLTGNEVLVRTTDFGDSDLNGVVTADDFSQFSIGFNGGSPPSWLYGDYNYDGFVTNDDYTLWLHSYNNGPANPLSAFVNPVGAIISPPAECCGGKPTFRDPAYSGTFTGQVAVATCYAPNLSDAVMGIVDLKNQGSAPLNINYAPPMYHGPATAPWTKARLGNIFGGA